MKVRIAAALVGVLLAASIGAWLWIDRDASAESGAPSAVRNPAQAAKIEGEVPRPLAAEFALRTGPAEPSPRMSAPVAAATRPAPNLPPTPVPRADPLPSVPPVSPASPPIVIAPPGSPDSDLSEKVAIDVDQVGLMLRDYRTRMGENPLGTNAEIMKAVMGENPKQVRLGPPEGQKLNAAGELVDRWGTPIFFHQLSKASMEIRSAGPDKVLWTDDDVIQR